MAAPASETKHKPEPTDDLPYRDRQQRLRAACREAKLDHLLVTNPKDVGYLTGFMGGDSYLLFHVRTNARPILVSDFRYEEELAPFKDSLQTVIRKGAMTDAVSELLDGLDQVGFQSEVMTVGERDSYTKKLGAAKAKLLPTRGLVTGLRVCKDKSEIKLIRKAVKIQEDALRAVLRRLKPGRTELQIAARLEEEMKSRGSEAPSFNTIVAAGATGSLPHYRPQDLKIKKGSTVLIDWGATYRGYHSDMTRTFALGKWPKKLKEVYPIVLEAHEKSAAALAPGKTTQEIDKIARDVITDAGFGDFFGHGLGHGIGLDIHEDPRVSHMAAPTPLKAGHVVTIEPGIYLPGIGGIRIEDDYAVTDTGSKCLCTLPRDLDWATL
jgi:Xaa-Pro aminopeptidase